MAVPEEAIAAEAVGSPDDIKTKESDTKLVEPTSLPDLGRRL